MTASASDSAPGRPRPELAVGAVAVCDGALLLVRRGRPPEAGRWSLPGGRLESGETVAAAVEREVMEETGLQVRCGKLIGWVERIGAGHHFVILDFAVVVSAGTLQAGGDADETAWVPLGELRQVELVSGLADFLEAHGVG